MVWFTYLKDEYHFYGTLVYVTSGTLRDGGHLMEMVDTMKHSTLFYIHKGRAPSKMT